jgi:Flp pilus assembly protein TadD
MNRFLATTAVAALCTAWTLATPVRADDDTPAPAPATSATPADDSATQPKTMQDAINAQIADAKAQRLQGHVDEAAKAFAQLMLVAPDDPAVLGEYGKALTQQGHSQAAVALLTRAIQLRSGDWTYYSALGVAYDQIDKRKEAREAYDRALALKPGEPSVLNNYAVSRMLAGDYAGAHKMFEQLQAMGANDPKIVGNLAKLAMLEGGHPQKSVPANVTASVPVPHAPVAVATIAAPKPQGSVMMEKIPVDPLAGPVGKPQATHAPAMLATAAPKPLVKTPAAAAPAKPVVAVAQTFNPTTTIMQKVPVDPLAGPVAPRVAAAVKKPAMKIAHAPKVEVAEKPKTVLAKETAPKLSAPPALRTASDSN